MVVGSTVGEMYSLGRMFVFPHPRKFLDFSHYKISSGAILG